MLRSAINIEQQSLPVLVVGLGLTGWSVVRYLQQRGAQVVVTDSRQNPPYLQQLKTTYPEISFRHALQPEQIAQYQAVIASPGIAINGANVKGDIELFAQAAMAPIIAITGSNGKSTVTMLVTEMLGAGGYVALPGGNIGTPALDLLAQPIPDFYVLELSSFQLETTQSLRAKSAVVLNLSQDHMDRYQSLPAYANAKLGIYKNATAIVINRDDTELALLYTRIYKKAGVATPARLSFGLDQPTASNFGIRVDKGRAFFAHADKLLAAVDDLLLQGAQNQLNVLAAMALISAAGVGLSAAIVQAAMRYPGLPHRCELVARHNQVSWINDSKGTNVGATLAAIHGITSPLVLIAGGQGKGADFSPLKAALRGNARLVVLIGDDAQKIAQALGDSVEIMRAQSLQQAIAVAVARSQPGDSVLFSPACASFDMFENYRHRGDVFRQLVKQRLPNSASVAAARHV